MYLMICVKLIAVMMFVLGVSTVVIADGTKKEDKKETAASQASEPVKSKSGDEGKKEAANTAQKTKRTKTCEFTITANDAMQFNTKSLNIAADCAKISVTLQNVGKLPKTAMGHNIVFAEKKNVDKLIAEGLQAGPKKDYIPESKNVLAASKLLSGGESDTIELDVGGYTDKELVFFCLFPGHTAAMRGAVTFEKEDSKQNS